MSFFQKSIRSDEDLLTSLRQGSEDAFTVIYERYHKLLYVLAYKYLKSTYSSEDAVQQVFLKLWEARSLLMVNVNLRNYLYTMLKNHVLNEIRNNNSAVEKNYEIVQSAPEYEDELLIKIEEQDMMSHFYQAIDHLPEQKRQVCLYKLKGNLSNQEIADKMNISVPTVKTHYAQAIKYCGHISRDYFYFFYICGTHPIDGFACQLIKKMNMKIPDLSIIEKTLNNEATSEESCEVVRWFKTPEGQAWLAERIDQDEKTIHMGEEEAWIDHPIPSAVMYQNIMRQLRRQKIRRFIAYAAAVFIPIALIIGLFIRINSQVDLLADDGYDEVYVPNGERMQVLFSRWE